MNIKTILLKLIIFIIISFIYFHATNQQLIYQNNNKEAFDQSSYMHYSKELYLARHVNKEELKKTHQTHAIEFFNKYYALNEADRLITFNETLSDLFNDFPNLSNKDKEFIKKRLKRKLQTNSKEFSNEDIEIMNVLFESKSFIFGDALDGNRMPLYPLIQSFFYNSKKNDDYFFKIGVKVNILLSFILLLSIFYIFLKYFSLYFALNNVLIICITIFVYKAPYFQCELLFYFLSFLCFIYYIKCFNNFNYINAILAGVFTGLAHLTKASILPGFFIMLFFLTVKNIKRLNDYRINSKILLIVFSFLFITFPFLIENKNKFGSYFYNVNSSVYMWRNSWDEIKKESVISQRNVSIFDRLSSKNLINRIGNGGIVLWKDFMSNYGYRKYILLYAITLMIFIFLNRKKFSFLIKKHLMLTSFVITYFLTYIVLYSWYFPIGPGNRFILSLYIPVLFTLCYAINSIYSARIETETSFSKYLTVFNTLIMTIIIVDTYFILKYRIIYFFGGW